MKHAAREHSLLDDLGDFTTTLRVLPIALLAGVIGAPATGDEHDRVAAMVVGGRDVREAQAFAQLFALTSAERKTLLVAGAAARE